MQSIWNVEQESIHLNIYLWRQELPSIMGKEAEEAQASETTTGIVFNIFVFHNSRLSKCVIIYFEYEIKNIVNITNS